MTISLCTFVKNESHCIGHMFDSVCSYVDEIVVVDTGSTDNTIEICKEYGARVYKIGFVDFGSLRTITAHLAREPWILMLDADETLDGSEHLRNIVYSIVCNEEAVALPRKRWLDLEKTRQTELEAYPDWQVRLYKNNINYIWKRELHEYFDGAAVFHLKPKNPWTLTIDHFHDVYKSKEDLVKRQILYEQLAKKAKVTIEGGKSI